ncbi:MAG: hypothetical protein QM756_00105 [Polyangiaceae bacterium]
MRTPEGQTLSSDTRALIARALGLLGSACVSLGELGKGEEVLRLAVQYAGDSPAASDVYLRLGDAMMSDGRSGEAIGPLRRAANLGAPSDRVWPLLARALMERGRMLAAYAAVLEGQSAGVSVDSLAAVLKQVSSSLGDPFQTLRQSIEKSAS